MLLHSTPTIVLAFISCLNAQKVTPVNPIPDIRKIFLGSCPDGSTAVGKCSESKKCTKDYFCVAGLCCPNCAKVSKTPSVSCEPSGVRWQPKQCNGKECWCVSLHGKELSNSRKKANDILDCKSVRRQFVQNIASSNDICMNGGQPLRNRNDQQIRFCDPVLRSAICPRGYECVPSNQYVGYICCTDPSFNPALVAGTSGFNNGFNEFNNGFNGAQTIPNQVMVSVCPYGGMPRMMNGQYQTCIQKSTGIKSIDIPGAQDCQGGYTCRFAPRLNDYICCTSQYQGSVYSGQITGTLTSDSQNFIPLGGTFPSSAINSGINQFAHGSNTYGQQSTFTYGNQGTNYNMGQLGGQQYPYNYGNQNYIGTSTSDTSPPASILQPIINPIPVRPSSGGNLISSSSMRNQCPLGARIVVTGGQVRDCTPGFASCPKGYDCVFATNYNKYVCCGIGSRYGNMVGTLSQGGFTNTGFTGPNSFGSSYPQPQTYPRNPNSGYVPPGSNTGQYIPQGNQGNYGSQYSCPPGMAEVAYVRLPGMNANGCNPRITTTCPVGSLCMFGSSVGRYVCCKGAKPYNTGASMAVGPYAATKELKDVKIDQKIDES